MRFLLALALVATPAVAASDDAGVIGTPAARRCFEAAAAGARSPSARRACDDALDDPRLSAKARAATLTNRGILRAAGDDGRGAIADYDAAIALHPGSAEAFVNKGLALLHIGRHEPALAALTTGLDLGPGRPAVAYYARGVASELLGRLRDAYRDYGMARQLEPDWPAPARELARFRIVRRKTMSA
ncbi:hypothetical protein IP88_01255 [alpha proteobacterium AAP81b]|nr:hypothetical protein IP88_01255 [alpha proteobacterium AAP81b]